MVEIGAGIETGIETGTWGAEVAALVRGARAHAGLTQRELAARLGTAQSVVSRWEQGHDEPRLRTLAHVLAACGLRLELRAAPDDVDRAQLRQQLALTPSARLASVTNVARLVAGARQVQ
jgi:transcriptional regulator with XRE-family HTH domain